MRSRFLLPLILLGVSPVALAGEVGVGVSGGTVLMDALEVLGPNVTVVPSVSYWVDPSVAIEVDVGVISGKTQYFYGEDPFSYFALTPRVNLVGRLFQGERVQPLLSLGAGAFLKSVDDGGVLELPTGDALDVDVLGNAGPGLLVPIGDPENATVNLRADLRWLLNIGSENWQNHGDAFLDWEATAGVYFLFGGPKDSDKDGFADDEERCPDQAEDLDSFEDDDGCPESDNDKDGALDADDKCPIEAEDKDGFEDADGCAEADNDKDGVLDDADQCRDVAGTAVFGGCPDSDSDGLQDSEDECPTAAGAIAAFGCPDKDGDFVPDARDACPDVKANEGSDPSRSDGCATKVFVSDKSLKITETVEFDSGKATIKPVSHALLDEVVRVLGKFPGIKRVQVEGHTDNVGDDAKNMKLSQDRADAVKTYLVSHGVAEGRLVAKGFGETAPIADNKTKEGQAVNRRVAFEILEQDVSDRAKKRLDGMKKTGESAPKAEEPAKTPAAPPTPALEKKAEEPAKATTAPPTPALEKKAEEPAKTPAALPTPALEKKAEEPAKATTAPPTPALEKKAEEPAKATTAPPTPAVEKKAEEPAKAAEPAKAEGTPTAPPAPPVEKKAEEPAKAAEPAKAEGTPTAPPAPPVEKKQ